MAGISSIPRHPFTPVRSSAGSHSPFPATDLPPLNRIPNAPRLRFRYLPRSSPSPRQNPNSPHDSASDSAPLLRQPSSSSIIVSAISRIRIDEISSEILYIALPAALALAADPLASLVDTAFVGHLGSVELAAVGVSVSVFNLISKLFNVPLLNITTSFVAEQQALMSGIGSSEEIVQTKEDFGSVAVGKPAVAANAESRKYIPAVSTSLALAAGIGIMETIALSLGSGLLMNIMGIPVLTPVYMGQDLDDAIVTGSLSGHVPW